MTSASVCVKAGQSVVFYVLQISFIWPTVLLPWNWGHAVYHTVYVVKLLVFVIIHLKLDKCYCCVGCSS